MTLNSVYTKFSTPPDLTKTLVDTFSARSCSLAFLRGYFFAERAERAEIAELAG